MVDINPITSIIILFINGLNPPIKEIIRMDQKTKANYLLSIRNALKYKDTYGLKSKGWGKIYLSNTNQK